MRMYYDVVQMIRPKMHTHNEKSLMKRYTPENHRLTKNHRNPKNPKDNPNPNPNSYHSTYR